MGMSKSKSMNSQNKDDVIVTPSTSKKVKLFLNRGKQFVRRSFQTTTDSEPVSDTAEAALVSPELPLTGDMGDVDANDSNRDYLMNMDDDSDSDATERVNHKRKSKPRISWNLKNIGTEGDSDSNSGSQKRRFSFDLKDLLSSTNKSNSSKGRRSKRFSWGSNRSGRFSGRMKKLLKPLTAPLTKPFLKGILRKNNKETTRGRGRRRKEPYVHRSSNGSISISIKSSEFEDSENVDTFDLSFSIMPRESMRNLMSQRNLNPDLIDDLDERDQVGLLAETRTPSFNVMLHANDIYSDNCTLLKRKTVRISWEDLANNTIIDEEQEALDFVRDLGGRCVSDMRFKIEEGDEADHSEVFGLRGLRSRGSLLVRMPSGKRAGSNKGGIPLWSGTSTIDFNKNFNSFVLHEKTKDWLKSFKGCDPRQQILKFFNDVANEGATGDCEDFGRDHISPLLKYLYRSSVFTVWRPTSLDAIRRMMLGEGVGKGLDIKGKSAKRGKLSAFVPFLQIFEEEDKQKVRTLHKDGTIRIFFNSERDRDLVVKNLNGLAKELEETVRVAKQILSEKEKHDEETIENAMSKMTLDMSDSTIHKINRYALSSKYGIEVQERLFWEGMVMRQNIYRRPGSKDDIGRTSMPSFQDMNFTSLRAPRNACGPHTRAVILQYNPPGEENNPMNPLNLLMAYEENDPDNGRCRVIPVVSDFDAFIVGTRGVRYEEEVPEDQVEILKWMIKQTEGVLDNPDTESWTKRWLNVLKESGTKGFHPKIPDGGYSDPKTKFIFEHAIGRLATTGAVRHGAECYNYYFPQELDEELLVISDELPDEYNRCNWTYVDQDQLKDILKFKIDKGYTFPLNPKWVLCDPGWKDVYDKAMASDAPNVQQSLDCFYPPESGIRELIEDIHKKHPRGFNRELDEVSMLRQQYQLHGKSGRLSQIDGTIAMDLAEQELKYYFILQRAKNRLRAYLRMNSILTQVRAERERSGKTEIEIPDDPSKEEEEEETIEGDDLNHEKSDKEKSMIVESESTEGDDENNEKGEEAAVNEAKTKECDDFDGEEDKPSSFKMSRMERFDERLEETTANETGIKEGNNLNRQESKQNSFNMSRMERFDERLEETTADETEIKEGDNLKSQESKQSSFNMSRMERFDERLEETTANGTEIKEDDGLDRQEDKPKSFKMSRMEKFEAF